MYTSPSYIEGVTPNEFSRKVFLWLFIGLLVTGISSFLFLSTGLFALVASNMILYFGMIIFELFLVFKLSASLFKMSAGAARACFLLYSVTTGITVAMLLFVYGIETTGLAFIYTAMLFGSMAFIGFTTKRNLMQFSSMFMAGLITLVIATLINIFLRLDGLNMILSYTGIVLFMGITAYDMQKMKNLYEANVGNDEVLNRLAIYSALELYLDFINIFIRVVQLLGRSNRR